MLDLLLLIFLLPGGHAILAVDRLTSYTDFQIVSHLLTDVAYEVLRVDLVLLLAC